MSSTEPNCLRLLRTSRLTAQPMNAIGSGKHLEKLVKFVCANVYSKMKPIQKAVFHSIKSARYNLFEALFSDQFFIDESIANDKEWYIGNSLYNSIMWYNTTFDIVLQFIWVHYRFFEKINSAQSFNFENSQAQDIFKKCRYESIEKLYSRTTFTLFNELKGLNNFITDIREWTNNIKHRGAFRITDIPISEGFNLKTVKELNPKDPEKEQIVYNSDKSIIKKSAKDITKLLIEYHKNLYSFIDTLFQESNINKS